MLQTDDILSHYKIISSIGAGGMGEVYLATDTRLDRQVALKVLLDDVSDDADRVERFVREAKAASALNHPNILTVFEIGTFGTSHYIATEFINGKTLRERIISGSVDVNEALGIALQIAAALGAAHAAGIIHRDIKPENIMVRDDGFVKVLDFGLAKLIEERPEIANSEDATKVQFNTKPGLVIGTVAYMSPEQARGQTVDAQSDIFSLGIVLYELFGGRRPFAGESSVDLISSILKDDPPPIRQLSPFLPRQLERIIDKTLRKDKAYRYQHIKDLEIDLADLREELKLEALISRTNEQALPAPLTETDISRPTLTESISTTRRFTLLHAFIFVVLASVVVGAISLFAARYSGLWAGRAVSVEKVSEIATWSSAPGELFSNASFSPDGKLIAFSSTRSGSKNIWVTQSSSNEPIQVTNDEFGSRDPIWSPKGDEIAYVSNRTSAVGGQPTTAVWRSSALGGGTPKFVGTVDDGSIELRRWAKSGKIYYQMNGDLHSVDLSGIYKRETTVQSPTGKVTWITISEDELSIAYVIENSDLSVVYVSDLANSSPKMVGESKGSVNGLAWRPDQKRIYISCLVLGVYQIFVIDGYSSKPNQVTTGETDSTVVDVSPAGDSLIVSSAKEESSLWKIGTSETQETALSRSVNSELWPAFAPNNDLFVFQSAKNLSRGNNLFESNLYSRSVTSNDDRPTLLAERGFLPTFSPDGRMIAFLRTTSDVLELFAVDPSGGAARKLATDGLVAVGYSVSPYNSLQTNAYAWSPDSTAIAFVANRNGIANVFSVNIITGSEAKLTELSDPNLAVYCPIWSSDGKRLAFYTQTRPAAGQQPLRGLYIYDTLTMKSNKVYESSEIFRFVGFTADENSLIIAESKGTSSLPPETVLRSISVFNGAVAEISRLQNAYFYNLFLSYDRKFVAFAARNNKKDDVWIVPIAAGSPRKLTSTVDSGQFISKLSWSKDGQSILYGRQSRFSLLNLISVKI